MKRGAGADIFLKTLEKVRAAVPDIALRTSFIVGFPGETDADFAVLTDFVRKPASTGSASSATLTRTARKLFTSMKSCPSVLSKLVAALS